MSGDLVFRGGRIIDPANGIDMVGDLVVAGGRVAGIGVAAPTGAQVVEAAGAIVTPGLIDLHTHVYWGGTSLGVDPDLYALKSACTTLVDAGSAGPGNYAGFAKHLIEPAFCRILAYLHVSFAGIYAFSNGVRVGETENMRLLAAREAAALARAHPHTVIGIKVRLGVYSSGPSGIMPLDVALDVADETGLPLMVHIDHPPPSYGEVVSRLRKGDVLTHCFRPFPNAPMHGDGTVRAEIRAARERGVIFDIGHGQGSFSWKSARAMQAQGFRPDVISSDVHAFCIDGPAHDNLRVMTKFRALGWSLPDVVEAASVAPARALRREDLGHLSPGATGDVSVIREEEGAIALDDVMGEVVNHNSCLKSVGIARAGVWRAA